MKTAVEWYAEQAMRLEIEKAKGNISLSQMLNSLTDCIEKAKEMGKKQIIEAHDAGVNAGYELAKNDDIYIDSGGFKNTCNSQKYYFIKYEKGEQ
jgi:hypothetical protein